MTYPEAVNSLEWMFLSKESLLADLKTALKGQVIGPQDAEYEAARWVVVGNFDRRPAAIVRPADAADVGLAIRAARAAGLELAVRSGGHSLAGFGTSEGGLVLDMSSMRALEIDPQARTAWADAGLTAGEYTAAAARYGLATGFGDTGSVGIGGLTLGGGIGYLSRKLGLTIDSLLAAEIVTAAGEVLYVDEEQHPDLFWALRGGGGNFGVVTRFKFQLHEVSTLVGGLLVLPATPEVIVGFMQAALAAPDELTAIVSVMPAPPAPFLPAELHGRLVLLANLAYLGPEAEAQAALQPFRALAQPLVDLVRPLAYPELFPPENHDVRPVVAGRTLLVETIDLAAAETILTFLQALDAPLHLVQLRALGGAMARPPVETSAYAHRQASYMVYIMTMVASPDEQTKCETWAAELAAALAQSNTGLYMNFLSAAEKDQARKAYPGSTWGRLREVKTRYDPTNIFRQNVNIPPLIALTGKR